MKQIHIYEKFEFRLACLKAYDNAPFFTEN